MLLIAMFLKIDSRFFEVVFFDITNKAFFF